MSTKAKYDKRTQTTDHAHHENAIQSKCGGRECRAEPKGARVLVRDARACPGRGSRAAREASASLRGRGARLGKRVSGTNRRLAEAHLGADSRGAGETWLLVAAALAHGLRGLPCSGTLARFFRERRGRFNPADLKLSDKQIVAWADSWLARTGDWPTRDSGRVLSGGRINWRLVDLALRAGCGEKREEGSLEDFLASRRGVARPQLSMEKILAWADAFHKRAAQWPTEVCGPVAEARTECWSEIDSALAAGLRGLPGGSSLAGLLAEKRKVRQRG